MKRRTIIEAVAIVFALLVQSLCCAGFAAAETAGLKEKVLTDLPTSWDLTGLYADADAFEADVKRVKELIPEIEALRGTLDSVEGILNYLENPKLLEIEAICDRISMYAECLQVLNAADPWGGQVYARGDEIDQMVSIAYAFLPSEIMQMPLERRQELLSDERLAPYAYFLRDYVDPDYTVLSEEAKRVDTLRKSAENQMAIYNIFDNVELPIPSFTYPDGTEGKLTDPEYIQILASGKYDHEFRKQLQGLRNAIRAPYANTYAALLEGAMRGYWAEAQIKGFGSTLEFSLHKIDVQPVIYEKIIAFAHSLRPRVHEYYSAKKTLLGLDEMMACDSMLPITDYEPKTLSYEDAVNIGRGTIAVWGDEYLETFDRIIETPHIDVYPTDTKMSGACESLGGNDRQPMILDERPFVMYNYDGTEAYTSSILHEMGHAVYSELSNENQNSYNNYPDIFTQEVASTANEIMFNRAMVEQAQTKEEKLYWMANEIDLFLNTIISQCMYSEFEDYCYKTIENGGSLNAGEMGEKWLELSRAYDGDAITFYDDCGIGWARIPHLYYMYYVFQYATSTTYAASICALVDEKGQAEIDAYMDFLKAGNSASPAELLKIAGVDPLKDETYEAAGALIEAMIDEFIATACEAD